MEERLQRIENAIGTLTLATTDVVNRTSTIEKIIARTEGNLNDLISIVASMKDYMTTKLDTKEELVETEERLSAKIEGVQRSVDGVYGLQNALETRVTKLERA